MWSAGLLAARLVLGGVFLLSGVGKLSSQALLPDEIMDYQLLSRRHAQQVAPLLPAVELTLAILCITGIGLPVAASLIFFLLLAFSAAILINLRRGRRFNCHCFGTSKALIGPAAVVRNIMLMAVAVFLAGESLSLLSPIATVMQWQTDMYQLVHLNTLAPLVATVLLSFSILLLLNQMDVVLAPVSRKGES